MSHPFFPVEPEVDLFKGVYNDDMYLEAQVKKEFQSERKKLEQEKKAIEARLLKLDENIKAEKAKRKFVPRVEFLLREEIEFKKQFIKDIVTLLNINDIEGLRNRIQSEVHNVVSSDRRISFGPQELDILYDYGQSKIYKKIKKNVKDEGIDEEFRKLDIRGNQKIPDRDNKRDEHTSDG